jgi:hypothetical protein
LGTSRSSGTPDATAQKPFDGKYDVTIKVETRKYKADAKGNEQKCQSTTISISRPSPNQA